MPQTARGAKADCVVNFLGLIVSPIFFLKILLLNLCSSRPMGGGKGGEMMVYSVNMEEVMLTMWRPGFYILGLVEIM